MSTNFNTSDMKVCFFDVSDDENEKDTLADASMSKLLLSAEYALRRAIKKNKNVKGFVVVNPDVIFGEKQFGALVVHFKKHKAKILSTVGDTLVIESKEEYIITMQMVGGARFVSNFKEDDKDSASDDSDYEDVTNQGLTQECTFFRS